MGRSFRIGTLAGISIRVHWTFLLLIGFVLFTSLTAGQNVPQALTSVAFVLVLFGCIALHELGHALAARWFGIPTQDITLLPIGGVARLARMPRRPLHELVVAVAGPMVNVAIAAVIFAGLWPTGDLNPVTLFPFAPEVFLQQLMWTNLVLVAFNMLPAFPMDGGRVLRALLAMVMNYSTATRVAAIVGQVFAMGFALLGFVNPFLFLVAVFIFLGAGGEARIVQIQERLRGVTVRDGMLTSFRALPNWIPVRDIAEQVIGGIQRSFPVVSNGTVIGMLGREDVIRSLNHEGDPVVSDVMRTDVQPVSEDEALETVVERLSETGRAARIVPVLSDGTLVGLLDPGLMFELVEARARLPREEPILATVVEPRAVASGAST
jgi:Zn-dependent protease/CBS domain-containing protein